MKLKETEALSRYGESVLVSCLTIIVLHQESLAQALGTGLTALALLLSPSHF